MLESVASLNQWMGLTGIVQRYIFDSNVIGGIGLRNQRRMNRLPKYARYGVFSRGLSEWLENPSLVATNRDVGLRPVEVERAKTHVVDGPN